MHQTPRYVLLVLLELCRLCAQRGIDSPAVHENRQREKQLQAEKQAAEAECRRKLQEERDAVIKKQQEVSSATSRSIALFHPSVFVSNVRSSLGSHANSVRCEPILSSEIHAVFSNPFFFSIILSLAVEKQRCDA